MKTSSLIIFSIFQDFPRYEVATADLRGNVIGPARVELIPFGLDGESCVFYGMDDDDEVDCIIGIKGKRGSGKDVILTDRDGETHYITFNSEDDAQTFLQNIDY